MHHILLLTHSVLRYLVLIALLWVIAKSLMGWLNKSQFTASDNKSSLILFSLTHLQLLVGIILYVVSPAVIFSSASMKNGLTRYWLVEHGLMMLIAIVLITLARILAKKATTDQAKFKRLFLFNAIALIIIVIAISLSGRGLFGFSA